MEKSVDVVLPSSESAQHAVDPQAVQTVVLHRGGRLTLNGAELQPAELAGNAHADAPGAGGDGGRHPLRQRAAGPGAGHRDGCRAARAHRTGGRRDRAGRAVSAPARPPFASEPEHEAEAPEPRLRRTLLLVGAAHLLVIARDLRLRPAPARRAAGDRLDRRRPRRRLRQPADPPAAETPEPPPEEPLARAAGARAGPAAPGAGAPAERDRGPRRYACAGHSPPDAAPHSQSDAEAHSESNACYPESVARRLRKLTPRASPKPAASPKAPGSPKPAATPKKAGVGAAAGEAAASPSAGKGAGSGKAAGATGPGKGSGTSGNGKGAGAPSDFGWYFSEIKDRFYSTWQQPTSIVRSSQKFFTRLKIKIGRDGKILGREIVTPSGNGVMDESVMTAARKGHADRRASRRGSAATALKSPSISNWIRTNRLPGSAPMKLIPLCWLLPARLFRSRRGDARHHRHQERQAHHRHRQNRGCRSRPHGESARQ